MSSTLETQLMKVHALQVGQNTFYWSDTTRLSTTINVQVIPTIAIAMDSHGNRKFAVYC